MSMVSPREGRFADLSACAADNDEARTPGVKPEVTAAPSPVLTETRAAIDPVFVSSPINVLDERHRVSKPTGTDRGEKFACSCATQIPPQALLMITKSVFERRSGCQVYSPGFSIWISFSSSLAKTREWASSGAPAMAASRRIALRRDIGFDMVG